MIKHKLKKTISFFLAIFMILTLTACDNTISTEDPTDETEDTWFLQRKPRDAYQLSACVDMPFCLWLHISQTADSSYDERVSFPGIGYFFQICNGPWWGFSCVCRRGVPHLECEFRMEQEKRSFHPALTRTDLRNYSGSEICICTSETCDILWADGSGASSDCPGWKS